LKVLNKSRFGVLLRGQVGGYLKLLRQPKRKNYKSTPLSWHLSGEGDRGTKSADVGSVPEVKG